MNDRPKNSLFSTFRELRMNKVDSILLFLFTTGQAFMEGFRIMMIIPLLAVIGIGDDSTQLHGGAVGKLGLKAMQAMGVEPSLVPVLILFLLISGILGLVRLFVQYLTARTSRDIVVMWRSALMNALLYSNWVKFKDQQRGKVSEIIVNEVRRVGQLQVQIVGLISGLTLLIIYSSLSLLTDFKITIIVFACFALFLVMNKVFSKRSQDLGKMRVTTNNRFSSQLIELFGLLDLTRIYGKEQSQFEHFAHMNQDVEHQRYRFLMNRSKLEYLTGVSATVLICAIVYLAVDVAQTDVASLVLLVVIFSRLFPRAQQLIVQYQSTLNSLPSLRAVQALKHELAGEDQQKAMSGNAQLGRLESIRVDQLSFDYDGKLVFEAFNSHIQVGKINAIVGDSGKGKSTLLALLMGAQSGYNGGIYYNDLELSELERASLQSKLGYLPQETMLLHASIKDNLMWVNPQATDELIVESLQKAGAYSFVMKLPQGMDTIVGERGEKLSGGERQRIGLARALVNRPELLILDEATSALDHNAESAIVDSLKGLEGDVTIIAATHGSLLQEHADHIIRL